VVHSGVEWRILDGGAEWGFCRFSWIFLCGIFSTLGYTVAEMLCIRGRNDIVAVG